MDKPKRRASTRTFPDKMELLCQRLVLRAGLRGEFLLETGQRILQSRVARGRFYKQPPLFGVKWNDMKEFTDKKSLGRRY